MVKGLVFKNELFEGLEHLNYKKLKWQVFVISLQKCYSLKKSVADVKKLLYDLFVVGWYWLRCIKNQNKKKGGYKMINLAYTSTVRRSSVFIGINAISASFVQLNSSVACGNQL